MLYFTQIVDKGVPKFEGGSDELMVTHQLTSMLRPQEMQVGKMSFRRECRTVLRPGTRSGAEASNPTGDAGCLGNAEWRRLVNIHHL